MERLSDNNVYHTADIVSICNNLILPDEGQTGDFRYDQIGVP